MAVPAVNLPGCIKVDLYVSHQDFMFHLTFFLKDHATQQLSKNFWKWWFGSDDFPFQLGDF